nr:immunoglobulin heavy chain junction region [Macaca mulatta]MOV39358.1 immunoglobulin heavy chain junction region [Macaca mulatta]MOV39577.1 immunoglobulin heavy chain junction region [Macaca mulatta]MOV40552.1 immunoglobulin heavy chain junction region [Macaca mulatta]MOV41958.1 immunoglobulin heavy chain junction region [Macaca mulatta]
CARFDVGTATAYPNYVLDSW